MAFLYNVFSNHFNQCIVKKAFSAAQLLLLPHLGVAHHIGHIGVGGLDGVAVDHIPQLVVE